MGLRDDVKILVKQYEDLKCTLAHNQELFNIFEGDLLTYLIEELKKQFTGPDGQLNKKSFSEAVKRLAPINISRRVIDKLSKIYSEPPVRKLSSGAQKKDEDLLDFYVKSFDINNTLGGADGANGFFNLFKNAWVEPFLDPTEKSAKLRIVPSDRFFVYSADTINPMRPTHFVKIMGTIRDGSGEKILMYAYTETEFVIFTWNGSESEIRDDMMAQAGLADGVNPLGKLPGVYINRSKYNLIPKVDSDFLAMTKLVPLCISDINFALMFQAFSIIYMIDVDQSGLKYSPNAIWDLKSDGKSDKEPKVGSIKPEIDSDKALAFILAQISLWLQTKNIKPGTIGTMGVDNAASAISKVVDEIDTSDDRKQQVPYFVKAEKELWDLVINDYHPIWMRQPGYKNPVAFTKGIEVTTTFSEQRPIIDTTKAIGDQSAMMEVQIQSRRGALKDLYPDWTDEQIEAKIAEVKEDIKEFGEILPQKPKVPGLMENPPGAQPGGTTPPEQKIQPKTQGAVA